jgi:hypothetical protein
MSEELFTVAEIRDLNEAHLIRSRLEAEGIRVFIMNQTVASLRDPQFYGDPKAELQVAARDAERAMAIFHDLENKRGEGGDASAVNVATYPSGLKILVVGLVVVAVLALLRYLLG